MKGRDEFKKKYDNRTEKLLIKCPDYVSEFASDFIDKSPATKYTYIQSSKMFLDYLDNNSIINIYDYHSLNSVKKSDINNYINSINKSDAYKARVVYALKCFFNFMVENNYIINNPVINVKAPKDKKQHEIITLSQKDIRHIISQIRKNEEKYMLIGSCMRKVEVTEQESIMRKMIVNRDLSIFLMGIMTGLRCSEIISINIDDVNFDDKIIVLIEKGGYERKVYIPDQLIEQLKVYLVYRKKYLDQINCDALFISKKKVRSNYAEINKMLKEATRDINKHITPHKMRSTYATTLYDKTGDIYLVAQGLNHKNLKNTMRYAKPSEEKNRAAADLMGNVFKGVK